MRNFDQVQLEQRDRDAILAAAAALRARLPVKHVILYGSKARGGGLPDSDIDLLVLTSRPLSSVERDQVVSILYPLELEHDVLLSALTVADDEWRNGVFQVMPIRAEIDRDGVVIPTDKRIAA